MRVWVVGEKYSWCFCRVYPENEEKKAKKYANDNGDQIILYDTKTHEEVKNHPVKKPDKNKMSNWILFVIGINCFSLGFSIGLLL